MGSKFSMLGADSGIPGFSRISSTFGTRKSFWICVVLIFILLTVRDLFDLLKDYVQYPVTVNVRVADSRVLPFPAITICNLNLVHRGRFCAANHIEKPEIIENILCAKIGDMLNECKISNMMHELMHQGEDICGLKKTITLKGETVLKLSNRSRLRGKRQLKFQDIIKTFREVGAAVRGDGQKGSSIIDVYNDFQDSVKSLADGTGGPLDETLTQIANFLGFNVSNSLDIIPMLFMKAFTDTTGCRLGSSDITDILPDNIRETLKKLTKTFMSRECMLKTPRLIRLFHDTSHRIVKSLNNCTTPWMELLKNSVKKGETPWFFLLDLLSSWLADLAKNHPEEAKQIGHHSKDLIKQCIFAGRTCSSEKDFSHFFYNSYGNCYTYNLQIDPNGQLSQDSLSGFTGPKFGLEILLNLETEQYMPTSRESGAKIIIHDSTARADPDQDSVHVAPGLVTYIGVRMVNITRLSYPYPDKCSNVWQDKELEQWARNLHYDAYSTQTCLKLCLQRFTVQYCGCWSPSSPPPNDQLPQCSQRKKKDDEACTQEIRQMYYNETINCDCPPRCSELSFEKFVSTGQELHQCSILTTAKFSNKATGKDSQIKKKNEDLHNTDADTENSDLKLDKENMAKVVVYFQSLSYQEITQYPKYTLTTLLGGIGGILGVYLGFSFMALFEVIDLFARVFCCGNTIDNKRIKTSTLEPLSILSAPSTSTITRSSKVSLFSSVLKRSSIKSRNI